MKFGYLENIEDVDFSLPLEPARNSMVLTGKPKEGARLFVGSTHWIDKEFVGNIYPAKAKANQYLYYYTRAFSTLELNATHYRVFDKKIVEKWAMQSSNHFVFCPKMYQLVSHRYRLKNAMAITEDVATSLGYLKEKLGPVFVQLPDNMNAETFGQIEHYLQESSHLLPLALEVRHHTFLHDEFWDMLTQFGTTTCITDVAGRRDLAHMQLTTPQVQIRFVGNGGHKSDFTRIDDWLDRLNFWFSMGLEKAFFFIHQPNPLTVKPLYDYLIIRAIQYPFVRLV